MNFTEEEKKRIVTAVEELEEVSSGEIVPYIVSKSDEYQEVRYYLATLSAVLSCILLGVLSFLWKLPAHITPLWSSLFILAAILFSYVITIVFPSMIRFFVPQERLLKHVITRAEAAFLEEEVFATRERTGVLIFISQLEHQAVILGDKGINEKVKPEEWTGMVEKLSLSIKKKNTTQGIVEAIHSCKELLLKHTFTIRSDDTNELPNDVRIRE
ncbi:MAG: TPM domain-containing protein [Cyclobacteriaceae bacterium]